MRAVHWYDRFDTDATSKSKESLMTTPVVSIAALDKAKQVIMEMVSRLDAFPDNIQPLWDEYVVALAHWGALVRNYPTPVVAITLTDEAAAKVRDDLIEAATKLNATVINLVGQLKINEIMAK